MNLEKLSNNEKFNKSVSNSKILSYREKIEPDAFSNDLTRNYSFHNKSEIFITNNNKTTTSYKNNLRVAPLNSYDEFLINDINPQFLLKYGEQRGLSRWRDVEGNYVWKDCKILSYDEQTQLYLIQFQNSQIKKKV